MPFNFWKRKPKPEKTRQSDDPERDHLQAELNKRQEQVAALELELLEFTQFNQEIETRLGPLQRHLAALEADLAKARLQSTRRAMWGERANSPEVPEDVTQQYKHAWTQPDTPPTPPRPQTATVPESKIKTLYRLLAKRFHPDLASTPAEKAVRAERMAEINAAYASHDWLKLQAIAEQPEQPAQLASSQSPTRAEMLLSLESEIKRLEGVIQKLENALTRDVSPALVDFKLEADLAHLAGRDLLAEMEADLQADIIRVKTELASLNA
jgi:hypothetical protein